MMDHALTNQDLGSDDAASCEVPLDDTELQRRFVETFEKELAPGGARRNRVWVILVVLAVFAIWWAFGVPQLLHGWFTDWWTMSSSSSRPQLDQATLDMLMNPNWTPRTIWQLAWEDRSGFALFIGGGVFLVMFLQWWSKRYRKQDRQRILQGARAFGLHVCPDCGADTRSAEGKNCGTCRENIRRERVPAYWRHRILEGSSAEKHYLPCGILADHAPDPRTRKRAGLIWIGATLFVTVVLSVLSPIVFQYAWFPILLWPVWIALLCGILVGLKKRFVSFLYSDSGWCLECDYELGETSSDRCPECGTACPVGYRTHLLESRPGWFTWVVIVMGLGWITSASFFILRGIGI